MKRIDVSNYQRDSSFYGQVDLLLTVKSFDLQAIRKRYLESKKNKRSGSTQRRKPALGGVVSLSLNKGKLLNDEVLSQLKEPRGIDFLNNKLAISSEEKVFVLTDEVQTLEKQLPIENFIKDQSQSPLQSLGFMPYQPKIKPVIGEISSGGAAERQGMKAGDQITAINGNAVDDWYQVVDYIRQSPEELLTFTVIRNGQTIDLKIMPQARKDAMGTETGFIGAGIKAENFVIPDAYKQTIQYSPVEALYRAGDKTWQLSVMTVNGIVKMVKGLIGLDNLSGPITIAKVAGQSAEMGWQTFFSFMALMSVSLGVLNLLPIPMLDGGHLVYYLIELIRGRPVSEQVQMFGLKIGMALLGMMMLLALFNDIMRF